MRTAFARERYVGWLRDAGAVDVACIPYNPYHELYRGRAIGRVQLPFYRLHGALRRTFGRAPYLRTWKCTAQCELLIGRKP